ncbi:MAG: hypothetical protein PHO28_04685 [Candidatus Pacebacteria bacterium]|nr:hypothetical protein [Candidatus Paceibacterota bacterium]
MDNSTEKQQMVTLKDFIKENYPLLSVLGVFGALFSLFYVVDFKLLNELKFYIEGIIFFMFILVAFEIWINFPRAKEIADSRLNLFEQFFLYFCIFVTIFVLYAFRNFIREFLSTILLCIYGGIANHFIKKFQLNKKVDDFANKYAGWRGTTIRSLFFLIFLGFIIIAVYFSDKLISLYWPK